MAVARKLEAEQFKIKKAKDLLHLGGGSVDEGLLTGRGSRLSLALALAAPVYAIMHLYAGATMCLSRCGATPHYPRCRPEADLRRPVRPLVQTATPSTKDGSNASPHPILQTCKTRSRPAVGIGARRRQQQRRRRAGLLEKSRSLPHGLGPRWPGCGRCLLVLGQQGTRRLRATARMASTTQECPAAGGSLLASRPF